MAGAPEIGRALRVEPGEGPLLLASAWYFFCLLLSFYILRPIRETAGISGDDPVLQWLFLGTFLTMLVAVPVYGLLVSLVSRVRFIGGSTLFFATHLVGFVLAFREMPEHRVAIGRVFFVWLSVFNLFVVSIFWSLMVERWSLEAGKRVFGAIMAGGTIGGFLGSMLTARTADRLTEEHLLLISALFLLATLGFLARIVRLQPTAVRTVPGEAERPIGGGVLEGLVAVARSPYLLRISAFIFLVTLCGTFVYFLQAELVSGFSLDPAVRRRIFADINAATQVLTLILQLFGVAALIRTVGVGKTLGVLPWVYLFGFVGFGALPVLATVAAFDVLRRAVGYGVASPTREVLYTVVPREEKYKAKAFIDTVVYRGGDVVSAQIFTGLAMVLPTRGIALLTVPICVIWLLLALAIGRDLARRSGGGEDAPAR